MPTLAFQIDLQIPWPGHELCGRDAERGAVPSQGTVLPLPDEGDAHREGEAVPGGSSTAATTRRRRGAWCLATLLFNGLFRIEELLAEKSTTFVRDQTLLGGGMGWTRRSAPSRWTSKAFLRYIKKG